MTIYTPPVILAPLPTPGARRLRAVASLICRPEGCSGQQVASDFGFSRSFLYQMKLVAETALTPRPPGPAPGSRAAACEVARLREQLEDARQQVEWLEAELEQSRCVDQGTLDRLILTCFAEGVSLRGTQNILGVAFGEECRPGLGQIAGQMKAYGRVAGDLLAEARDQVASDLVCVMADDIYFRRTDIKVVAEPESMALLQVGSWDGGSGADWQLWLEEYDNLALLTSDLGRDLVGAASSMGVRQAADLWHELRWFDRKVFAPLSRFEAKARQEYWQLLDRATRVEGPGRRLSSDRVLQAEKLANSREQLFLVMVEVVDQIRAIYDPLHPQTGLLWTSDEVNRVIDDILARLEPLDHPAVRRARKHIRSNRDRFWAHHIMFDLIDVPLVEGTSWSARSVLDGILILRQLRREQSNPDKWVDYATWKDRERLARGLERRLRRACPSLDEVAVALWRELRTPRRSSSGVESLNSRLRVLQMAHRNVSDEMLDLAALAWNLTPRISGKRKGRSPYELLGIDFAGNREPWYEVLLDRCQAT